MLSVLNGDKNSKGNEQLLNHNEIVTGSRKRDMNNG